MPCDVARVALVVLVAAMRPASAVADSWVVGAGVDGSVAWGDHRALGMTCDCLAIPIGLSGRLEAGRSFALSVDLVLVPRLSAEATRIFAPGGASSSWQATAGVALAERSANRLWIDVGAGYGQHATDEAIPLEKTGLIVVAAAGLDHAIGAQLRLGFRVGLSLLRGDDRAGGFSSSLDPWIFRLSVGPTLTAEL